MTANVTCLGCGCACDDIEIVARDSRIVQATNACELGVRWFGDGRVPSRARVGERDVERHEAIRAAAQLLMEASRPLVYLAPDLSCEAQRETVGVADALGAALDSVTSATALRSILAAQERGRTGATLGEIRNRADVVVCWNVDPSINYPRFSSRYAPEAAGRTIIRIDIDADSEVATLTALAAIVSGRVSGASGTGPAWARARDLGPRLLAGRYVAIVADAEPDDAQPRDPGRADALISLAQALNTPTRAALSLLRAGGNRSGADAVMTWQTGYPMTVDFTHGHPRYQPYEGTAAARLDRGDVLALLVVGAADLIPLALRTRMAQVPRVVVGPRASDSALALPGDVAAGNGVASVVIDTGIAGIHDGGTAMRMDDVPLPLRPSLAGPHNTADVVGALAALVRTRHEAAAR
jgi:formylmethanofuran dehydrogenase subunit B